MFHFRVADLFRWATVLSACLGVAYHLEPELGDFFLFYVALYVGSHGLSLRIRGWLILIACLFAAVPFLGGGIGWFGWPEGPEWPTLQLSQPYFEETVRKIYSLAEFPIRLPLEFGRSAMAMYWPDSPSWTKPFWVFAFWCMTAIVLGMSVAVTMGRRRWPSASLRAARPTPDSRSPSPLDSAVPDRA